MAKKDKDVTHLIERLEVFEERAAIRLEAVSATLVGFFDHETIQIYGEVHAQIGSTLDNDVEITAAVYDAGNKIVAARTCCIEAENFFGFEVFELQVNADKVLEVTKVRILTKKL